MDKDHQNKIEQSLNKQSASTKALMSQPLSGLKAEDAEAEAVSAFDRRKKSNTGIDNFMTSLPDTSSRGFNRAPGTVKYSQSRKMYHS